MERTRIRNQKQRDDTDDGESKRGVPYIGRRLAARRQLESARTRPVPDRIKFSGASPVLRKTTVVNKYHTSARGVSIMRPGKWGNPFKENTREENVKKFRKWFLSNRRMVIQCIVNLSGKTLICCCKPKECHGDVYAEVCNSDWAYWWKLQHL